MAGHNIDVNVNFGSANQNFQTLIDSMNRLQGIVTQLGTTIQTTNNNTATSNTKAQKSITDYAGSYKTLTEDIKKNRAELAKQIAALEELRKISSVTGKANTAATNEQVESIKKLETAIKQQSTTLKQYNTALGNTSKQAKVATNSLDSLVKGFNSLGAVLGVSFGAYGAFRVLSNAVKAVTEFDLAQKKLQSILAETNAGMVDIANSAIAIGKSSIFGAKGVTDLQIELAKMGFAKEEIISMQRAITNLATATQEELAPSAEVVANILRAFQLPASEATKVVDIMGKAFNDSALDLANFREAIKYVAPIASQANFTFAETVSLLEQLSNAGIKGSLAGTGLTNIISRLGNENSKFVKTLGRTVNGFDDFLAALVELNNRGADLTDIFELVDRRAAATFSILLEGVDTVEEFKQKLEGASGVMQEQAAVQLDSIAYRAKLVTEAWKAMVIEIDKGSGIISKTSKALLTAVSRLELWIGGIESGATRQITALEKLERRMRAMGITKTFFEATVAKSDATAAAQKNVLGDKIGAAALLENALGLGSKAESLMTEEIAKKQAEIANNYINLFIKQATNQINKQTTEKNKDEALFNVYNTSLRQLTANKDKFLKMGAAGKDAADAEQLAIDKLSEAYENLGKTYKSLTDEEGGGSGDGLSKLKAQLELQKQIAINSIKLTQSAEDDRRAIIEETYLWDKKIATLTIQNAEEKASRLIIIEQEWRMAIEQLGLDNYKDFLETKKKEEEVLAEFYKQWNDIVESSYKDQAKLDEENSKQIEENLNNWFETYEKNYKKLAELKNKNPLLGLFVDFSQQELAEMTPEDIDKLSNSFDAWDDSLKSIEDSLKSFADTWVESFDRIVDARNNMVSEAQQALETELQLAEAGFASNVSLKREELAEAKKLREQALEDQKKAQKLQLAIDSAAQASSLAVTIANYFQATSKIPVVGVALALAAIGTMLGTFAKFKALAKEQAAVKYEKGGWIGGMLHSQGGTHIEAEKGEFVINRKAAAKHKLMIEAINNDDNVSINKMYINGLKQTALKASVSLDDSEDLKAIRKALERNNKEVTYFGNYRIEKAGNITTKIRVN